METYQSIISLIEIKFENKYESCVRMAREVFDDYFNFHIRDLLHMFPIDHKNNDGQPFWSGPKRAPSPIVFDSSNDTHVTFVQCFANLISEALDIDTKDQDLQAVRKIVKTIKSKKYERKTIKV